MRRGVVEAFYLPSAIAGAVETAVQRFGPAHDSAELRLPVFGPSDIARWIDHLKRSRSEYLAGRPIAATLRTLERVVERYLEPKDRARRKVVEALAEIGRFAPLSVERALDDAFLPLARGGLRKWVASELGSVSALDRPFPSREGILRRALGPEWMLQIYAGNVPAIPVWPMLSALLLKSALLAKTSAQEPVLAPALARSIAEEDADLGRCMIVVWWKGGADELDRAALSGAPAVLAFGGEVAIASIARLAMPGAALVLHGPKVSATYLGRGSLARSGLAELARRAALDVALYDQQGCLSPHAIYVERGGVVTPADFAEALGEALEQSMETLPRREPTTAEAASLQLYRAQARLEAAVNAGTRIMESRAGTQWMVVCERGARFEPSPMRRTIRVHEITGPEEFERAIGPATKYIEALAVEERGPRRAALAARFAALGIPRIAEVGSLQRPTPLDTHGGLRRLLPFVSWSTVDPVRSKRSVAVSVRTKASKPSRAGSRKGARSRRPPR